MVFMAKVVVEELEWPAQRSTPLNVFGVNWNVDCVPGVLTQHHWMTSLLVLGLNEQVPTATLQNLKERLTRRLL